MIQKLKQNKAKILAELENFNLIENTVDSFNSELIALKKEIEDCDIFDSNNSSFEESIKVSCIQLGNHPNSQIESPEIRFLNFFPECPFFLIPISRNFFFLNIHFPEYQFFEICTPKI